MSGRDRWNELQTNPRQQQRRQQQPSSTTLNQQEVRPRQASNAAGNGDDSVFYRKMEDISRTLQTIDKNVNDIARLHENALVVVNQEETRRVTRELDELQSKTSGLMDEIRSTLASLARETKRMNGSQVAARKSQQSAAARKLIDAARRYEAVQDKYKERYQARIAREIRIDASQHEIQEAVRSGNSSVFAQEMLSSRVGDQRRVLQEVQGRHEEIMKIEQSVEQLATLFQDMQVLLEQQQESIKVIETQVEQANNFVEDGGKEIGQAIEYRISSRKKLWWISGIVLVLLVVLAVVIYVNRCSWLTVQCPAPSKQ